MRAGLAMFWLAGMGQSMHSAAISAEDPASLAPGSLAVEVRAK